MGGSLRILIMQLGAVSFTIPGGACALRNACGRLNLPEVLLNLGFFSHIRVA